MNKNLISSLLFLLLFFPIYVSGQTEEAYKPQIFGTLKSAYEVDLEDGYTRFITRNARLGLRGKVNKYIGYKFQTEYNASGKLTVLDSYGEFYATDKITFMLGQVFIPFAEDYVITPGQYMFASMSFLYPYVSAQSRDIGFNVQYKGKVGSIPVTWQTGAFNGAGINKPTWERDPTISTRLIFGELRNGFRSSLKYFTSLSNNHKVHTYGLDLRYNTRRWKLEAEWNSCDSVNVDQLSMSAYFLQGTYNVYMNDEAEMIKYAMATGRIESIGNEVFKNGFSVTRMTLGLNFGFDARPLKGEIRINYESSFVRRDKDPIFLKQFENKPIVIEDRIMKDKIIFELLLNL